MNETDITCAVNLGIGDMFIDPNTGMISLVLMKPHKISASGGIQQFDAFKVSLILFWALQAHGNLKKYTFGTDTIVEVIERGSRNF